MGLFSTLFGGSKNSSSSSNRFADQINQQFSPMIAPGVQSMGAAANILGLGGPEARSSALSNWWDSSGGDFLLNQGLDDVDAMYRSKGLANSGAAMKEMENYRSGLASTKLGEGMSQLTDLSRLSLGAGGLIANTGQQSQGTGKNNNGIGGFLGAGLSLLSDPKAKKDITPTGSIGTYTFRYKNDPKGELHHGIMADEVAEKLPQAAGKNLAGMRTVDLMKFAEAQI